MMRTCSKPTNSANHYWPSVPDTCTCPDVQQQDGGTRHEWKLPKSFYAARVIILS
jgi:hypothetical protein